MTIVTVPVLLFLATIFFSEDIALDFSAILILATANSVSLGIALATLKSRSAPTALYTGPLIVLILGGMVQALFIAHSAANSNDFLTLYMPEQTWITPDQAAAGLVRTSIGLVTFCVAVIILAPILKGRNGISDRPAAVSEPRIIRWYVAGLIAYIILGFIQFRLGVGQGALYAPNALPLRLDSALLFLRDNVAPLLLLLMLWIGDRHSVRLVRLSYLGFLCIVVSDLVIATSRGALFNVGIPIFFLWLITGRLTFRRKTILAAGFVAYLVIAPVVSDVRVSRVTAAVSQSSSTTGLTLDAAEIVDRSQEQVFHFIVRVQGAGSVIWALEAERTLSPASLWQVFRPYGMTEYFTFEVVDLPRDNIVKQGRAPTVVGLGTLAGGLAGTVVVVSLVVIGAAIAQNRVMARSRAWPVGAAVVASTLVTFFSEGVPMNVYKSAIAFVIVEIVYRKMSTTRTTPGSVRIGESESSISEAAIGSGTS